MRALLFLTLTASVSCGCGDATEGAPDLAVRDASASSDLAPDLGLQTCTLLGAWPGLEPFGFYDPDYLSSGPATVAFSRQANGQPWDELSVEAWHAQPYPTSVTFKTNDTYELCDTCVVYGSKCDDKGCADYYLAQGGTAMVTRADQDPQVGRLQATASSLNLVEWDFMADAPVPSARCVEIASASWDVSWMDVDGGAHD